MYLLFHLWSLEWFPFVHSDEVWLASLTRSMLHEGSVAVTEDFFRLTPRHPHALKTLFHLAQMPFVAIAFDHYSVRLLSLFAGFFTLLFLFAAGRTDRFEDPALRWVALVPAALLAVDIQFIYIAHFARQEALLLALFAWMLWRSLAESAHAAEPSSEPEESVAVRSLAHRYALRPVMVRGVVIGLAAAVHPNAFLVGVAALAMIATEPTPLRVRAVRGALCAVLMGCAAALAVVASFAMDPHFLRNYAAFGAEVGVGAGPIERVFGLPRHLTTLFFQRAGTYYLPPVQPQLVLFALSLAAAPLFRRIPTVRRLAAAQIGVLVGMVIVGKYAPPAAVLLWPAGMLLLWAILRRLLGQPRPTAAGAAGLIILLAFTSVSALTEEYNAQRAGGDYRGYLRAIRDATASVEPRHGTSAPPVVLANLNSGFAFAPGQLRVWRDLQHLPRPEPRGAPPHEGLLTFLRDENVELIFYPDELDVIFNERPVWNAVYGNLYPFYDELQRILREDASHVTSFSSGCYAMRLVRYRCGTPLSVRVYRLSETE